MTFSELRRPSAALVVALGLLFANRAAAQRTAADIETARQLYNQGIDLRDKGDNKGALEKFRAAHALGNTPITGIELCKMHVTLQQPVEAREICLGVSRIPPLAQETSRSQDARQEAARIAEAQRPKIGTLTLKLVGVPDGSEPIVTVDGVAIPPAALGAPRAVNPGLHVVTARVGKGGETRASLETFEGESRDLELAVVPPPPEASPPPAGNGASGPKEPPPKKKSSFPTTAFVTGGIFAGIGAIAGLVAFSKESSLADKCPSKQCGTELHGDIDSARDWATVSTVTFVVAGVCLATGLVATLVGSKSSGRAGPSHGAPSANAGLADAATSSSSRFAVGPGGFYGRF